jgi:glycosyltransferase involved in cell wall biosynthesis
VESVGAKVLMITPFTTVQRGNSLTTARLQRFLNKHGVHIDRQSLEGNDWPERLQQALAETEYNLIHGFHALHFGRALTAVPALRQLPMILTTTGTDIHYDLQGPQQELILATMRAVQKIVVFNADFRRDLQACYPEWGDKLVTIPQGVFLETGVVKTRREIGLAPEDFVFLLPSGLRSVKNIALAIDAMSELHRDYPRLRLLIIGAVIDEDYALPLLKRISELDWIIYRGEVPHEEMGVLLALGDVVLNTSQSEGQPQAALEAMSLGKPCILTAVPGNLNLIENGREGFYVQDQYELAAAATTLLGNPLLRQEMGQKARRLVATRFTLQSEMDAYRQLYSETACLH